jgi:hypothetical protein
LTIAEGSDDRERSLSIVTLTDERLVTTGKGELAHQQFDHKRVDLGSGMETKPILRFPSVPRALIAILYPLTQQQVTQAPAPRVKKSVAELLAGKWKLVERKNQIALPADWEITREFHGIGKGWLVISISGSNPVPPPPRKALFEVEGNILHIYTDIDKFAPSRHSALTIKSISDEECVLQETNTEIPKTSTYRRIRANE